MDVGLNNTNKLHLALDKPNLEGVEWLVEASGAELSSLRREYQGKHSWESCGMGDMVTIMNLQIIPKEVRNEDAKLKAKKEVMPICINFSYAIIDGHKICFYSSNSMVAHFGYIEAFLITYFQRTHDKYARWNQVDASNFHNCIGYLDTIDKSPRDTKYKPSGHLKKYHIFKEIVDGK